MNRIAPRQIYFFLACIAPVGKLVILPAKLVSAAQNDILFPAALHFIIQAAAIFCVLLLAKRGMTFYELLENTFGKIVAKILAVIFALFLLFAALLPLLEQKLFVQSALYDMLPSLVAFAPYFVFAAYLCAKPLFNFGRTWDILAPIAIVGIAGLILFSVTSADFGALAPVGASGGKGFLNGVTMGFSWFFDAALLIPLLGRIEYRKGLPWKGVLCYLAGGAAVLFFFAVFYGVFQETAINQLFAFTSTSKYHSAVTAMGRVDYLFIFLLALVMAFYATLPLQGGIDCVLQFSGRKKWLPSLLGVLVATLFFALSIILDYRFTEVVEAASKTLFWIFPVFSVAIPALMLLLRRRKREIS